MKLFFFEYARNRHKMTTLTPSYHAVCLLNTKANRPRIRVADALYRSNTVPTITVRFYPLCRPTRVDAHRSYPGFDLRPFLYPSRFPWQFKKIDAAAARWADRTSVHARAARDEEAIKAHEVD